MPSRYLNCRPPRMTAWEPHPLGGRRGSRGVEPQALVVGGRRIGERWRLPGPVDCRRERGPAVDLSASVDQVAGAGLAAGGFEAGVELLGQPPVPERVRRHHRGRGRVSYDLGQFVRPVDGHDGDGDGPDAPGGRGDGQNLETIYQRHHHPVPRLHPLPEQIDGNGVRPATQIGEGEGGVPEGDTSAVPPTGLGASCQIPDPLDHPGPHVVRGHHPSPPPSNCGERERDTYASIPRPGSNSSCSARRIGRYSIWRV
jgi:hypothetical protein